MLDHDEQWYRPLGPARRAGHPGCHEIVRGLIVGEYPTPEDADWLHTQLGVGAVINLQDDYDLAGKFLRRADLERAYGARDIVFHHVPIPDGDAEYLSQQLDHLVRLMSDAGQAGRTIYLHCNAGMNRAPTVAIAYLHAGHGLDLAEAIELMKRRRPCLPYVRALDLRYRPDATM